MTKKIISAFFAALMVFSFFTVAVQAEDTVETADAIKISDLKAAYEAGEQTVLQPGDIIEVDNDDSGILFFEYALPAKADKAETFSPGEYTYFRDTNQQTGYVVKEIGVGRTTTSNKSGSTNVLIDFANKKEYDFEGWTVVFVYSESNYNEIRVIPTWQIPVLDGWAGFMEMFRDYMKMIIDFFNDYLNGMFAWLKDWGMQ
ncbi:MAG: hypothetical protein FWF05_01715 [Oscillospiraceae bacterium]|nr:hypothetical protein [Oscillospiraceae bacterium]